MKFEVTGKINITENCLIVPFKRYDLAAKVIEEQADAKYQVVCEIRQERPKRSLNANAYCWVLINEIADSLGTSNDEVYKTMLQRYSKAYTFIIVKPEAVEQTIRTLSDAHIYAFDIGNISVGGKEGVQLQLFYGSSTFDSKQMSRLIDGIVSEAKELGIETLTPDEIDRMKSEWNK